MMCLLVLLDMNFRAGNLFERFGREKQKKPFLEKLYKGKQSGSNFLTEPEAGYIATCPWKQQSMKRLKGNP